MLKRNKDKSIDAYASSRDYMTLTIKEPLEFNSRLKEDSRLFTYERYSEEIHPPIAIESIKTEELLGEYPRCLDMPLRLAGSAEYRLPKEWWGFQEIIQDIIAVEHQHNPNWVEYNTYLTIDCKYVDPEEQQRHGGLHVDGFQGERILEKTKINRNYVATSNGGTRFYPQRFIVADPKFFNVFEGFDLQAEEFIIAKPNCIYFMDAYTVHESGFAEFKGLRTFIRITYDVKDFDRLGNTHNSSIDYSWDMTERNVHEALARPKLTDIEKSPYFPNPRSV